MRHINYRFPAQTTVDEDYSYLHPDLRPVQPSPPPPAPINDMPPPIFDYELGIMWLPHRMNVCMNPWEMTMNNVPQGPMFPDQDESSEQGSSPGVANKWGVNIDPDSQLQTNCTSNTRYATRSQTTSPLSSPLNGKSTPATPSKLSSKRSKSRTEEEELDSVPGLYKRTGRITWKCVFRDPSNRSSRASCCNKTIVGSRNLRRHIGVHAKREQELIDDDELAPEEAIALPRQVLMEYECEDRNCGYLKENGKPYRFVDYRVDSKKAQHLRKYH